MTPSEYDELRMALLVRLVILQDEIMTQAAALEESHPGLTEEISRCLDPDEKD